MRRSGCSCRGRRGRCWWQLAEHAAKDHGRLGRRGNCRQPESLCRRLRRLGELLGRLPRSPPASSRLSPAASWAPPVTWGHLRRLPGRLGRLLGRLRRPETHEERPEPAEKSPEGRVERSGAPHQAIRRSRSAAGATHSAVGDLFPAQGGTRGRVVYNGAGAQDAQLAVLPLGEAVERLGSAAPVALATGREGAHHG